MTAHTVIDTTAAPVDALHAIEAQATNSAAARALYKKRTPIYPKLAHGRFRSLKWAAMVVLLVIYYATPWIRWERPGAIPDQAVLVDFAGRRFYFFAIELWPQETYYITGLLILAAFGIFLSSALFGRVWCGYACPQTVWTDLYIHVERWIEGDRAERMRLAKAPFSVSKAVKKISKHAVWLLIALATGGAWIFYFTDAPTLLRDLLGGAASAPAYFFIGLLTFTTYALAGTMREQVCTYMCPWPRIQAAMIDRDALSVVYRSWRGEPRAPHKKDASWKGRGDCIDCRQCVAVCPQGIDIREGDQLECINCALCIDACDDIMLKVGRPTGLIAYDSFRNLERMKEGKPARQRFLRPRTLLYGVLLALVGAVMLCALVTRKELALDVMRDRNPPYVRLATGGIRNDYTVRIVNKSAHARRVVLSATGLPHMSSSVLGVPPGADDVITLPVRADAVTTTRVYIVSTTPPPGSSPVELKITDAGTGETATRKAVFIAGGKP